MDKNKLKEVLKSVFGYDSFRGDQEAIILRNLAGENSLLIMPTGMGKSLCYQLPSQILPGLTLVISPLIALMKDQVDQAQKLGLQATFINSSLSKKERESRYEKLANRRYKLLFVTPERFRKKDFLAALGQNEISLLAIDEAHCISEWGHDFRPDYTKLGEIRRELKNPPTLMLTATATPEVQGDIVASMGLKSSEVKIFTSGIERPNLHISMENHIGTPAKIERFLELRQKIKGAGIFYFSLVSTLTEFAEHLHRKKMDLDVYHGQLSPRDRRRNQDRFISSSDGIILATPAFGMGVDKPNIRWVDHAEIPGSIESYYQEIGRGGRDGQKSFTHLFYDPDDITIQMDFIKWSNPDPEFLRRCFQLLKRFPDKFRQEGFNFLRGEMHFYNKRDFRVETAVNLLEHWGFIEWEEDNRGILTIEEPTGVLMQDDLHSKRVKGQNTKLLQMVQLAKSEECRKKIIYQYFGHETKECGFCDNCEA